MSKDQTRGFSRRKFLGTTTAVIGGITMGSQSVFGAPSILKHYKKPDSMIDGVQIGVITYSYRSMPDQSAEATLKYILDSGVNAIELMGDPAESFAGKPQSSIDRRAFYGLMRKQRNNETLSENEQKELKEMESAANAYRMEVAKWRSSVSMEKFEKMGKMYKDAGVSIYGFKPSAFGKDNSDAEINYGFKAAKALGASHVTLEHPSDDEHTRKLGDMASKHKIYVAYHGHTQETPTFWDTALEQSKWNAMNIDIGHYVAAGNTDSIAIINAKHDRILSMHLKDRKTPANGADNMPWGEGDTPIRDILQTMKNNKYSFPATVELEYKIPDGSDAVKEVQRCVEYCQHVLTT